MYFDYLNVLVFAAVGLAFVFVNLIIASVLRPKRKSKVGLETYECGEETIGDSWIQFDIRYYTVALVYVIFAVEIAFLFPWALVLKSAAASDGIGVFVLIEGVLFIAILLLGLAYVWCKGDLEWVLSYSGPEYNPGDDRDPVKLPNIKELEAALEASDEHDSEASEEEAA
ncbi:MAG TPA: NADH-quinone oxidoreductase subunit A [Planctomycetes bacterium]|nr:NADH-quinone oxidoreductase subunit A [Planctomycetota bacterium]